LDSKVETRVYGSVVVVVGRVEVIGLWRRGVQCGYLVLPRQATLHSLPQPLLATIASDALITPVLLYVYTATFL
jgi:hypothetical protein